MANAYRAAPLNACQIRAARGMLGWSRQDLAQRTGLGESTVRRLEAAKGVPSTSVDTLMRVRVAFEREGVAFIADDGTPEGGPGLRYALPHPLRTMPWDSGVDRPGPRPPQP